MPNGLRNWSYKDVTEFLRKNSFSFYEYRKGSHEAWIKEDGTLNPPIVEVNFIQKSECYPQRTLETMIRQSRIDEKIWREWAST